MSETEAEKPAPSAGEQALGTVKGLVEEHPVAMLAGGILLGALVAGALSRSAKPAPEAKPKRSFGRRAVQLATLGAELAAAYAAGAESMAEEAAETAKASVKSTAAAAPEAVRSARQRAGSLAEAALRTLGPVIRSRLGRKPVD
jgi:hypothetical protein